MHPQDVDSTATKDIAEEGSKEVAGSEDGTAYPLQSNGQMDKQRVVGDAAPQQAAGYSRSNGAPCLLPLCTYTLSADSPPLQSRPLDTKMIRLKDEANYSNSGSVLPSTKDPNAVTSRITKELHANMSDNDEMASFTLVECCVKSDVPDSQILSVSTASSEGHPILSVPPDKVLKAQRAAPAKVTELVQILSAPQIQEELPQSTLHIFRAGPLASSSFPLSTSVAVETSSAIAWKTDPQRDAGNNSGESQISPFMLSGSSISFTNLTAAAPPSAPMLNATGGAVPVVPKLDCTPGNLNRFSTTHLFENKSRNDVSTENGTCGSAVENSVRSTPQPSLPSVRSCRHLHRALGAPPLSLRDLFPDLPEEMYLSRERLYVSSDAHKKLGKGVFGEVIQGELYPLDVRVPIHYSPVESSLLRSSSINTPCYDFPLLSKPQTLAPVAVYSAPTMEMTATGAVAATGTTHAAAVNRNVTSIPLHQQPYSEHTAQFYNNVYTQSAHSSVMHSHRRKNSEFIPPLSSKLKDAERAITPLFEVHYFSGSSRRASGWMAVDCADINRDARSTRSTERLVSHLSHTHLSPRRDMPLSQKRMPIAARTFSEGCAYNDTNADSNVTPGGEVVRASSRNQCLETHVKSTSVRRQKTSSPVMCEDMTAQVILDDGDGKETQVHIPDIRVEVNPNANSARKKHCMDYSTSMSDLGLDTRASNVIFCEANHCSAGEDVDRLPSGCSNCFRGSPRRPGSVKQNVSVDSESLSPLLSELPNFIQISEDNHQSSRSINTVAATYATSTAGAARTVQLSEAASTMEEATRERGVPFRMVAVKKVFKAELCRTHVLQSFRNEIMMATQLEHPCLISVFGVTEDQECMYLVMDLAENGSLDKYLRKYGVEDAAAMAPRFLADVVLALEYLRNGRLHPYYPQQPFTMNSSLFSVVRSTAISVRRESSDVVSSSEPSIRCNSSHTERMFSVDSMKRAGNNFSHEDHPPAVVSTERDGNETSEQRFLFEGIVQHRDLKPANMLLTWDYRVKVADFGSACFLGNYEANRFGGSPAYVSPEVIRENCAGPSSDLWALGCVLYELTQGVSPFKANTPFMTTQNVKKYRPGTLDFPLEISLEAKDLINRLLQPNPADRLGSIEQGGFEALKKHPFFKDIDWDTVLETTDTTANTDCTAELTEYLQANESVVYCSPVEPLECDVIPELSVESGKGLMVLALTDAPRLFVVDPARAVSFVVPWSSKLHVLAEGAEEFQIVAPPLTPPLRFKDKNRRTDLWALKTNELVLKCTTNDADCCDADKGTKDFDPIQFTFASASHGSELCSTSLLSQVRPAPRLARRHPLHSVSPSVCVIGPQTARTVVAPFSSTHLRASTSSFSVVFGSGETKPNGTYSVSPITPLSTEGRPRRARLRQFPAVLVQANPESRMTHESSANHSDLQAKTVK